MRLLLTLLFSLHLFCISHAQIPEAEMDAMIQKTLSTFDVPGISVGIIKDGKIVYAKGHGVRSLNSGLPMNKETLVGIASISKQFTCFALAMLVDEGKLNWDDKVRKYIPEFKLYDPFVSEEITVRDLVTHRSGLPLGAGDLMFFPEGSDFEVQDIVNNVRYLKPEYSFRNGFRYNNNMFIVAGEVLKRVSGMEWADFIETRILKPAGMHMSRGSYGRSSDVVNKIEAHTRAEKKVIQIKHDWHRIANAAGGIMSNVPDMLKWSKFLLNDAVTEDGKRLLSKDQLNELWTIQTPMKPRSGAYSSRFRGYGLGYFLSDQDGHFQIRHSGGLIGTVTQFTLFPDLDLGIIVLTNQMVGGAFAALTNEIKDSYLGYEDRNWIDKYGTSHKKYLAYNDSIKTEVYDHVKNALSEKCLQLDKDQIVGTYTDPWWGDINIENDGKNFRIRSVRSPRLKGQLLPYNAFTMVAKWDDRSYDADVFVLFSLDKDGMAEEFKMEHIAPITDFSFDFGHLHFVKKK